MFCLITVPYRSELDAFQEILSHVVVKLREQERRKTEKREQEAEVERKKQAAREVAERNEQRAAQDAAQENEARRLEMRRCAFKSIKYSFVLLLFVKCFFFCVRMITFY